MGPGSCGDDGNSESLFIENSTQKKAKIETECEETDRIDWISQLPDALIIQILSLLSLTDACRTTILSKRWQYLWTCIDNLSYHNKEYSCPDSLTAHKFISLTDNVLPLLSCSSIKKLSLGFMLNYDDGVSYNPKIDKWLEFAVNKKMEDLFLNILYTVRADKHDQPYSLPQVLCSSSSIVKLECWNCRISEDYVLNWKSLKNLTLEYLFLREKHIEQIMSNCPQLESLKLCAFCGFNRLHMTSPKCRRLQLTDHDHPDGDWGSFEGDCFFEIVAPYVQHLKISGNFDHSEIRLKGLTSLVHAELTFCADEYDENTVKDLLVSVRCANELILSSWYIKVISSLIFEKESFISLPLLECKWLAISSHITNYSFPGLDTLLKSTLNLENLMIAPDMPPDQLFPEDAIVLSDDAYLSLHADNFKYFLYKLKNVKVISSFCNRVDRADGAKLRQLLKFLLEHAINLEKLIIAPEHKECNFCSTGISELMESVLAFPTTSKSAVISFGSISHNIFSKDI
ncbi:hypothetical protein HAX54_033526 [Datura stramonium]|uniref:F-box domain-containing protein n=1 Tax=Datura stramonium TaxID=4076 RepID=A0ABS8RLR9_DATST|nr:hypothetical protein [Datura stramonium]